MKQILYLRLLPVVILYSSCSSYTWHEVKNTGDHQREEKTTTIRSNASYCFKVETVKVTGTETKTVRSLTVTHYDCRGAYAFVVKRQEWQRQNGRLVPVTSLAE
jgi:hypothetical protein